MSTLDRVKKVVVEQLSVDEELITPEATFTTDLGADSLDIVELAEKFEDRFGIEVSDDDIMEIKTIYDIVNYLDNKGIKGWKSDF